MASTSPLDPQPALAVPTAASASSASASGDDPLRNGAVEAMLGALRESLDLDVVFVSEFVDGQRMFRFVDARPGAPSIQAGDFNDLEDSVCQRVVDGRLPEFIADVSSLGPEFDLPALAIRVGTHLSVPVVLRDGRTFGTLCCFSTGVNPKLQASDLAHLRACSASVARKIERAQASGLHEPRPGWKSAPNARYETPVWKIRDAWSLGRDGQLRFLNA